MEHQLSTSSAVCTASNVGCVGRGPAAGELPGGLAGEQACGSAECPTGGRRRARGGCQNSTAHCAAALTSVGRIVVHGVERRQRQLSHNNRQVQQHQANDGVVGCPALQHLAALALQAGRGGAGRRAVGGWGGWGGARPADKCVGVQQH